MIKINGAQGPAGIAHQTEVNECDETAPESSLPASTPSEFEKKSREPMTLAPTLDAPELPSDLKMKSFRLPFGMRVRVPVPEQQPKSDGPVCELPSEPVAVGSPTFDEPRAQTMAFPENGSPSFEEPSAQTMAFPENGSPSFDEPRAQTMAFPENGSPRFDEPRAQTMAIPENGNPGFFRPGVGIDRVEARDPAKDRLLGATLLKRLLNRKEVGGNTAEGVLRRKLEALQQAKMARAEPSDEKSDEKTVQNPKRRNTGTNLV